MQNWKVCWTLAYKKLKERNVLKNDIILNFLLTAEAHLREVFKNPCPVAKSASDIKITDKNTSLIKAKELKD